MRRHVQTACASFVRIVSVNSKKRNELVQTITALSVKYATFAVSRGVNVGGSATFTTSTDAAVTAEPMGRAVSVFTFRCAGLPASPDDFSSIDRHRRHPPMQRCRTTQYRQSSASQKDCGYLRQRLYRGRFDEPPLSYDACVCAG